ncbi:rhamnose ABC transporter substrate-binding protein [Streptomyces cocklensis]|uniref:Autoinducer 2-binding protein LsrB n=1 Tax=Actinacidiphila cocklensis TaxID=887465 RepID=A0A9W4GN61_9ACTN|nr:rhamnose ABC transporter substrate-binding protein [Actinacidiphila cocklensis]MDD1063584.1 rhamnose ABC transporter substrate-binding protein [Actinacidiphila cocklensis]WSX72967.1 rhamnose ABC transporter substrate-binding protein [Streptomyces sp. NBC_00899]WSX80966.1 rhamnose ABC transporter substrate-binding protein [Streptomyces sp. NBC_00899]CAG6391001.1 Autoinducer 2-binding protein LsrB [Actinacidiphila cocklensis]
MSERTTPARRLTAVVAVVGVVALGAAACGGTTKNSSSKDSSSAPTAASTASADPGAPLKKGLTIAYLPKAVNNPYFTTSDTGGRKAVEAAGSTYKEVGTSSSTDTAGQVSYVNTLTQQRVDAIAVSAQDPGALCTALNQARKNGVKVVTYDSDTNAGCRDVFISQASSEDLGRTEVQLMAEQIGNKGRIAILSAAQTATNQNTWIGFMKDELKKPQYKDIQLVKVAYGNDDAQTSFQQTQGLLQQYPDLKGIISPTTVGIKAAAQYLSGSKYKGKVQLTGLGTPNDMRAYVADGTVRSFELWDPAKLGALAAHTAIALVSGRITGAPGQTYTAGDMGTFTIGQDSTVVLGKPTVFDKSTIGQFNF